MNLGRSAFVSFEILMISVTLQRIQQIYKDCMQDHKDERGAFAR